MLLQHAIDIGGLQPRLRIRDTVRPVCNGSGSAAGSKVPETHQELYYLRYGRIGRASLDRSRAIVGFKTAQISRVH
jgi:hypothetical protein